MQLAEVDIARPRFPADSRRQEWSERIETPATALWWVPVGHEPTADEALSRLAYLREHGPTARAFTVRSRFTPDGRREVRSGPRGRTRRPASPFS